MKKQYNWMTPYPNGTISDPKRFAVTVNTDIPVADWPIPMKNCVAEAISIFGARAKRIEHTPIIPLQHKEINSGQYVCNVIPAGICIEKYPMNTIEEHNPIWDVVAWNSSSRTSVIGAIAERR